MQVRQSFTALALHHQAIAARLRTQYDRLHRGDLADLIRRDQAAEGIVGDLEPEQAAVGLAALAEGLAYYVLIGAATATAARDQVLDAIADLYRRPSPDSAEPRSSFGVVGLPDGYPLP